ncbi:hypothetical protein N9X71_02590, partial [Paracoccus sp. (in: a-proteobacteria)]|nr:hypothetical protein [Paracoccus sp. (in: a-proteobacteria)]
VGDVIRVRVTEIDLARNRIGLTMRKDGGAGAARQAGPDHAAAPDPDPGPDAAAGAFGAALADAMRRR